MNNDTKQHLKVILQNHRGRGHAITRRRLREVLEIRLTQDRALRLIIAELRHNGFPVLFATDSPSGYYLAENVTELRAGIEKMRSYVINECIIMRDLKLKGSRYLAEDLQAQLL